MYEAVLDQTTHRPYALPAGPWVAFQSWREQLFAHWRAPEDQLRLLVPEALEIDTFDGSAWVSATPFRVERFHARGLPPLPPVAEYLELNLRTYVRHGGIGGVWFFSLDASSRLASAGGRAFYRLPYFTAHMAMRPVSSGVVFESRRLDGKAAFRARYAPTGAPAHAVAGSLEYFLAERYALFAPLHRGGVLRAHIHHAPWDLCPADAEVDAFGLVAAAGLDFELREPLVQYTDRQDTLIWAPERLDER